MEKSIHTFLLIINCSLSLFVIWFAVISLIERERRAFIRALGIALIPLILWSVYFYNGSYDTTIEMVIIVMSTVTGCWLFWPWGKKMKVEDDPNIRIDEREIMFSRAELKPDSEKFKQYYAQRPSHKSLDDEWRSKPGLAAKTSTFYQTKPMAACHASFSAVGALQQLVDSPVEKNTALNKPKNLNRFLKGWMKRLGAYEVGFTALKDYHKYSIVGRGEEYGDEVKLEHDNAIAFTVEMDHQMMASSPYASSIMESASQYMEAAKIAVQVAEFLRTLGYEARAHIDANYRLICPLVARDAGLGEIGRMGLLMTPGLGPRVRIGVVTTNAPLKVITRNADASVADFCTICKKCAENCPSQSIPFGDQERINGTYRWQINSESCFAYWCTVGTDCGRCMAVCPYSHPNNLLHNIVRWGIKNFRNFRRFALWMDDFFYGRKPKPLKLPHWMQ
ncbi:4Fe-4S dicluster domain-containing protein [Puteibacter caeruleilacunae]|nr:4Fe-4S dicluster domain-containing protein [Puteibacter caeruleilacunae]